MAISNLTMRPVEDEMITAVNAMQRAVEPFYPEISKRQPMRPAEIELLESVNILRDKFDLFMSELMMYGQSSQFTTTGKNVFDPAIITECGYTESDGVYTGNLSLFYRNLPNHQYAPDGLRENTAYVFRLTQVAVGSAASGNRLSVKFVYSDGTKSPANYTDSGLRTYIWISDGSKTLTAIEFSYIRNETFSFKDVMLAEYALGVDYEPYTGGMPSPSPEYPQTITSIDSLSIEVIESESTIPIDLQGHELRSLPDGTKDELSIEYVEGNMYSVTLTQRVGSVDMGTLTWVYSSSYVMMTSTLAYAALGVRLATQLMCDEYASYPSDTITNLRDNMPDKALSFRANYNTIYVKDNDYVDAEAFTEAVSGTILDYPLAEPVEISLGTVELPNIDNVNNVHIIANDGIVVEYDYDYAIRRVIING